MRQEERKKVRYYNQLEQPVGRVCPCPPLLSSPLLSSPPRSGDAAGRGRHGGRVGAGRAGASLFLLPGDLREEEILCVSALHRRTARVPEDLPCPGELFRVFPDLHHSSLDLRTLLQSRSVLALRSSLFIRTLPLLPWIFPVSSGTSHSSVFQCSGSLGSPRVLLPRRSLLPLSLLPGPGPGPAPPVCPEPGGLRRRRRRRKSPTEESE